MHSFTTERLLIRPLAEQDRILYLSLYTDAKVMRNIGKPLTAEAAEKAFASTLRAMEKTEPKVLTWAIVDLVDKKTIGIQGFTWSPSANNNLEFEKDKIAEIGIMLLRNSNGQLLPEEAISSLIEYGFIHLKLEQINACFTKKNLATARVSKKSGFVLSDKHQNDNTSHRTESVFRTNWQGNYIEDLI